MSAVSEDHIQLLKKQTELVLQMKEVLEKQRRTLEQLGVFDNDEETVPVAFAEAATAVDSDCEKDIQALKDGAFGGNEDSTPKILIAGPPAGGKGTQCECIKEKYGVVHISTGDLLRAEVKNGTPEGKQADECMKGGKLVPDELIITMVKKRLAEEDVKKNGWLLDGFPRTKAQAEALQQAGIVPQVMLLLEVPDEVLIERVEGRRNDPLTGKVYHVKFNPPPADADLIKRLEQRKDDTREAMVTRLETYHKNISEIIDVYTHLLAKVDGKRDKLAVWNDINIIIKMSIPYQKFDTSANALAWIQKTAEPSNWSWEDSKAKEAAPQSGYELEHVYGYRFFGTRSNIASTDDGRIIFPVGNLCVVMNTTTKEQVFFKGHKCAVSALSYNHVKRIVASGEHGKNPALKIWSVDAPTAVIASFRSHSHTICSVELNPDGTKVLSVGLDAEHTVCVHDVPTKACLLRSPTGGHLVLTAAWNLSAGADPSSQFVTAGAKHIAFWAFAGASVNRTDAVIGRPGALQTFLAISFTPSFTLIGCESGELYCFDSHRLKRKITAHQGALYAAVWSMPTNRLVTGGRDGFVSIWDASTLKCLSTWDFNKEDASGARNSIRALAIDVKQPATILVGTSSSSIYSLNSEENSIVTLSVGHPRVAALAVHPEQKKFVTAGGDGSIRLWDVSTKNWSTRVDVGECGTCAVFHPSGKTCAVGFASGEIKLFMTSTLGEFYSSSQFSKPVHCIAFSTDGTMLAAGGAQRDVLLFQFAEEEVTLMHRLKGCSTTVRSLAFSTDGKYLSAATDNGDFTCFDTKTGAVSKDDLRDVAWCSAIACTWNTQGVWSSRPSAVERTKSGALVASADDSGIVKLFQHPCVGSGIDRSTGSLQRAPQCIALAGHSGAVGTIAFTSDDSTMLTAGAIDSALMQWRAAAK